MSGIANNYFVVFQLSYNLAIQISFSPTAHGVENFFLGSFFPSKDDFVPFLHPVEIEAIKKGLPENR